MKDEKMKCVSGGALNSPLTQDIVEDIRHQVVKHIWANKDVGHVFLTALEKYHTVNEILDKIDSKEKVESLLRLKGIEHIEKSDVEMLWKIVVGLKSHLMMKNVAGGYTQDLNSPIILSRILDEVRNGIVCANLNADELARVKKALSAINSYSQLQEISTNLQVLQEYLSSYSLNLSSDKLEAVLSLIRRAARTVSLKDVAGGADLSVSSFLEAPLTDEMVNEVAMRLNEFIVNPTLNLQANTNVSNLPHLARILKEYGTTSNLYNALTNKAVLTGVFKELGYNLSETNINAIIPVMKADLNRLIKK